MGPTSSTPPYERLSCQFRQHCQRFLGTWLFQSGGGIVSITDDPALVYDKDGGRADQEELFGLEVLRRHLGTFIGQDGVGWMEFIDVLLDHAGSVGDHYEDLGVEGLELGVVMTQLRHVVHAVRSGKTDVEHQ